MGDDDFRELIESAHLARQVQQHPGWGIVSTIVDEQVAARQRWLLNGNAKTVEEYRSAAGWVQGANAVLHLADRLEEQVDAERKRREQTQAA